MKTSRMLIIENSVAMRNGLKGLLGSLHVEITEASNGLDGFQLACGNHFDVIITSVDLPKMDGLELCRRLKNIPTTQDTPIIVFSSFESQTAVEKALQAGASAYIIKREALTRLYDTVQEFLLKSPERPEQIIMIVDDSQSIRTLVQNGLMTAGFRVIPAKNGKEALALLNQTRPDLIVSDLNMPQMDGFELCEALHSDPEFATIPFVVMSSVKDRGEMRRIIKYGATDYILKPFNVDEMVIHIERFLADRFKLLLKDKERLDSERDMLLGSIAGLLAMLEARSPCLKRHAEAVAGIASGMATLAGASKMGIEHLTIGAQLHDIGKVGLRDAILFKYEPLTDQEAACMRQHPEIGSNILKTIPHIPSEAISIVLFHHERPDGKGYPSGLKTEQIPKWAGITAVAEKYHEFIAPSPCGQALHRDKALQIMKAISGTELCPEYVSLFLDWIGSKGT
jgi:putative two-component system response regulator